MLGNTMNQKPGTLSDDVTVCVPGAMLAAAPAAEAPPVFVDDSGTRRKLIRVTGVVVMLVLVGFLGLVGVALAVPSVGATVGLGNVTPFLVPGAAAKPPPPAPVAVVKKRVQTIAPARRSTPKPQVAATTQPAPKKEAPVVIAPPTTEPPTTAPPVTAPPTTVAPTTVPPVVAPPVVAPPVVDPPVVNPPAPAPPVVVDPPKAAEPAPQNGAPSQPAGQADPAAAAAPAQAPVLVAQNG